MWPDREHDWARHGMERIYDLVRPCAITTHKGLLGHLYGLLLSRLLQLNKWDFVIQTAIAVKQLKDLLQIPGDEL